MRVCADVRLHGCVVSSRFGCRRREVHTQSATKLNIVMDFEGSSE